MHLLVLGDWVLLGKTGSDSQYLRTLGTLHRAGVLIANIRVPSGYIGPIFTVQHTCSSRDSRG